MPRDVYFLHAISYQLRLALLIAWHRSTPQCPKDQIIRNLCFFLKRAITEKIHKISKQQKKKQSRLEAINYCAYNIKLKYIFDPLKDQINILKHGVSLSEAFKFEWDSSISWPDHRLNYGENRILGLGYIGNRLFFIVFVDRDQQRRIISLRKANQREVRRYAET